MQAILLNSALLMYSLFSVRNYAQQLRHRAKTFIGARPWLFFPMFRRRSAFDDLLVTRSTDLCIEGFPRSGNSFAVGTVEHAQSQPVQIAHHTHVPANAMRACEWDIPTLVLVREPKDAVISGVALSKQVQEEEHDADDSVQFVPYRDRLWAWKIFYRSLLSYRNRILAATLGAVVEDMGCVVDQVNDRFGTDFERFDPTPENVSEVHSGRGYHAGPSERRAELKEETRADFDERLRSDPALRETLSDAEALHERFVEEGSTVASP
jgi:hypothetical protein